MPISHISQKILTGEGPILRVHCLQPHPGVHSSLTVLQHYRIHGIRPRYEAVAMVQATGAMEHKEGNHLFYYYLCLLLRVRFDVVYLLANEVKGHWHYQIIIIIII